MQWGSEEYDIPIQKFFLKMPVNNQSKRMTDCEKNSEVTLLEPLSSYFPIDPPPLKMSGYATDYVSRLESAEFIRANGSVTQKRRTPSIDRPAPGCQWPSTDPSVEHPVNYITPTGRHLSSGLGGAEQQHSPTAASRECPANDGDS